MKTLKANCAKIKKKSVNLCFKLTKEISNEISSLVKKLKLDDKYSYQSVVMQVVMTTKSVIKHLQHISHVILIFI